MDTLEERMRVAMLYDFYGALLKEKQQKILEAYLEDDFSMTEIADELEITRQGVSDAIKRATEKLYGYEEKLGLLARFEKQKKEIEKLQKMLKDREKEKAASTVWKDIIVVLDRILSEI